jgi:hypothetical protein
MSNIIAIVLGPAAISAVVASFVNGLFNLAIKTGRKACLIGNRATPGGRFYASIRRAITLRGNASAPV